MGVHNQKCRLFCIKYKNMPKKYYKIKISETAKPMGNNQTSYNIFNTAKEYFNTLDEVKKYLENKYNTCKRTPIYRDNENGDALKVGKIYCYTTNSNGEYYFEQDWTEVWEIEKTPLQSRLFYFN